MRRLTAAAWDHAWKAVALGLTVVALGYALQGWTTTTSVEHAFQSETTQYQSLQHKSSEQTLAEVQLRCDVSQLTAIVSFQASELNQFHSANVAFFERIRAVIIANRGSGVATAVNELRRFHFPASVKHQPVPQAHCVPKEHP